FKHSSLVWREAVIQREQFSMTQRGSRRAPPLRRRTELNGKAVGQSRRQSSNLVIREPCFAQRQARPLKPVAIQQDAPFKPAALGRVPAKPMDGQCIKKLVREDDTANAGRLLGRRLGALSLAEFLEAARPFHHGGKLAEVALLEFAAPYGWLDNPVLQPRE